MEKESSMNSSIRKEVVSSKRITNNYCEESGWTAYFEDLSDDHQHSNLSSTSFSSSSMVSDASSYPLLLKSCKEVNANVPYSASMPKKLNFKKSSRAKEISHVDLEDTASSPVNSPKVSDLRTSDYMNPRKADDNHNMCSSLVKGGSSEQFSGLQDETICKTNIQGENDGYTNLKKKGLCLVPMSFLVNYLG